MSITYALYLAEAVEPEALLAGLGERLGLGLAPEPVGQAVITERIAGLDVSACAVLGPMRAFLAEDFDFEASVSLVLGLQKDDLALAQRRLVEILNAVRQRWAGDLLLLREGDAVAYRRRAGVQEIGQTDPLWHEPSRRALLEDPSRAT